MELDGRDADSPPEMPPLPVQTGFAPIHEASKLRMLGGKNNGMNGTTPPSSSADHEARSAAAALELKVPNLELMKARKPVKYRECLKNHAASMGGHALDGCGEFMPSGEEGSIEALKCAACECHRNFHRREVEGERDDVHHKKRFSHHLLPAPHAPPLALPPPPALMPRPGPLGAPPPPMLMALAGGRPDEQEGDGGGLISPSLTSSHHQHSHHHHHHHHSSSGIMRKRFRTKFTSEQKERMWEFAEKLGWRIQKHDEQAVQQFCADVGVKRHVLKVWMHNNKNTLGKKPTL